MVRFFLTIFASCCFACAFAQGADASANQNAAVTTQKGHIIPKTHESVLIESRADACAPATALRDLEWNNVRALIENAGALWYNRAIDKGAFMVPKEEGVSVVYGGALWMGGISPDQQLKLAAVRYRNTGNDFWPGPLTNTGGAEVDPATCEQYDKFAISQRADAMRHRQYFDCQADPECDMEEQFPNGYSIPPYFFDYPAHGNVSLNQDFYLSPFLDYDGNGFYEPSAGDYPWYDFLQEIDCEERRREDPVPLYGDQTYYWIFNDKGNIHTESQGEPIGMEIRAQAFAFSTNDEVNNMQFYNYVVINQGTQTLTETYFAQWVDCDLGGHVDDYVGVDVRRGLGYAYNGDAFDEATSYSIGYGENPPAMGVDFFEGPYQDSDSIDNPLTDVFTDAIDSLGIPYSGIGIGYGDGIKDNERYGMRKFIYYNWNFGINGQPTLAAQYYNYMRGYWKNGQRMAYGGDGLTPASGANLEIPADYMFPDDTDPYSWGTGGVNVEPWTEVSAGNPQGDRLFLQSAGPFTLEPGDYNNITVGMVWARATGGEPFESVELLRLADDKAQALFDNCFEIVSGPDAPDLAIQELENELILYITNENPISNNYKEEYTAMDPSIPTELEDGTVLSDDERSYVFEGYKVYQLSDKTVSPSDLGDINKSRLIAQCDVQNGVNQVINYTFDAVMATPVPTLEADGTDDGIFHSMSITTDAFAQGDNRLVNHKTYYFMVLAYGYNNYEEYNSVLGSGQDVQFKASRKAAVGSIRSYSGVPHSPNPESGGTVQYAAYGSGVEMTRHEGKGNGTTNLDITEASEMDILDNNIASTVTYKAGHGPVEVRVVDPLRVPSADFELRVAGDDADLEDAVDAFWTLTNLTMLEDNDPDNDYKAIHESSSSIALLNEELLLDWGLSVTVHQYAYPEEGKFTEPVHASISFDNPAQPWLLGIPDREGFSELNWIRAGNQEGADDVPSEVIFNDLKTGNPLDEDEVYEGILGGTWAPYCLVSYTGDVELPTGEVVSIPAIAPTIDGLEGDLSPFSGISGLNNVDVVLTSDKDKWTRCPVLEMQAVPELAQSTDGSDADKLSLRRHPSVDKNGRYNGQNGYNSGEANPNGSQSMGMGWFPGYAIDVSTGERLNMAFGEDSWLSADNGNDMLWNPSPNINGGVGGGFGGGGATYAGGQHWIYVFKNSQYEEGSENRMPAYDGGNYLHENLEANASTTTVRRVFRACTWVGSSLLNEDYAMLSPEDGLIPNDVRIRLRVAKAYEKYSPTNIDAENYEGATNFWNPLYTFSTANVATDLGNAVALSEALDQINVVPNPYYAFSAYETSKLDNRIKITNLPEVCTISIFNLQGVLVRQFSKADPLTSLDWDLKNEKNVPIAGGIYIIHVDVPGIGERTLKWFGIMRPTDLDNF
ncbi:MAG: T9SS type A sorting domain-containing protein [Bacteroidetes bacterium]|nr:T9SS type A sorting domain-containing protein [Bacteroidota bacterium]